jgi:hypothetical protein
MKKAGKYKYFYEMYTKIAYNWLPVWVDANHPSFKNCIIDMSENVHDGMNHIMEKIIEEGLRTTDPDIIGISSMLDAKDEENSEGMYNIDHEAASPYKIHTAVLPKPSHMDANINSAITAMLDIVQPRMMIPMKMRPIATRFYLMRITPETNQLFQCHLNQMSQLLNGWTTKH